MTDGSGVQKQAAAGKTTGSMSGRKPTVWAKHTRGGLFLLQESKCFPAIKKPPAGCAARREEAACAVCSRAEQKLCCREKRQRRRCEAHFCSYNRELLSRAARRKKEPQNPSKAERPLADGMQEMSHSEKESIVWK